MRLTSRFPKTRIVKTIGLLFLLVLTLGLNACSWLNWGEKNNPSSQQSTKKTIPKLPAAASEVEVIELPLPDFSKQPVATENTVIAILQDVEIQYETPLQLNQICRALSDMATLSVADLQNQRYADFDGTVGQWTLLQILYAYFLPPKTVDLASFYDDMDKPLSREIVRKTLEDLTTYCEPSQANQPASNGENVW